LTFTGSVSPDGVDLKWSTATEVNFDYFSIERSTNGKDFSEIARVGGHGNSITRKDYLFTDNTPVNGRAYYRLKSVDYDLYTEYFEPITVLYHGKNGVSVYPNPNDGSSIDVMINFAPGDADRIIIQDHFGLEIFKTPVSEMKMELTFSKKLDPGVYLIKYSSPDFDRVQRFVVTR
jgi:hypothetical protein